MERTGRLTAELAPPLMTVKECAQLRCVKPGYIRKLVARGS